MLADEFAALVDGREGPRGAGRSSSPRSATFSSPAQARPASPRRNARLAGLRRRARPRRPLDRAARRLLAARRRGLGRPALHRLCRTRPGRRRPPAERGAGSWSRAAAASEPAALRGRHRGRAALPAQPWRILVGGGVTEADFARLARRAPAHVAVERARPDFRASCGRRGLGEPGRLQHRRRPAARRAAGRARPLRGAARERAAPARRALRRRGARDRLAGGRSLAPTPWPAPSRQPSPAAGPMRALDLGGAGGSARGDSRRAIVRRSEVDAAWSAARRGPDRAARRHGRTSALWWRDDDAVAATPALDRLLALSPASACRSRSP